MNFNGWSDGRGRTNGGRGSRRTKINLREDNAEIEIGRMELT